MQRQEDERAGDVNARDVVDIVEAHHLEAFRSRVYTYVYPVEGRALKLERSSGCAHEKKIDLEC